MSDSYVEILVKKENTVLGTLLRVLCTTLTICIFLFAIAVSSFVIVVLGFASIVLLRYVWLNTDVEYEYLFLEKELTIDKIMAKSKRKRVATFDMERMEIMAPANSYHFDDYRNRKLKEVDYSSGIKKQPDVRFAMVYDGTQKVFFSEDPRLATAVKQIAPRKVFLD